MAFCSECGKEVNETSKFCQECGAPTQPDESILPAAAALAPQMTSSTVPHHLMPRSRARILVPIGVGVAGLLIAAILLLKGATSARPAHAVHSLLTATHQHGHGTIVHTSPGAPAVLNVATQYPLPAGPLDTATTVATVNGRGIPRAEFDHWLEVAARGQRPPTATPSPGDPSYISLLGQTMAFLVGSAWVEQEAAWRGIVVTPSELQTELAKDRHHQYKTDAAWLRFLRTSGQTVADLELRVRQTILSRKIQAQVIRGARNAQAQQAAQSAFVMQFEDRLKPITQCAAGFVVRDCANYVTPTTTPSPQG
jgi:hypothetical protein